MPHIIDTLLLPRWIIPVEPHNVFHENMALAIDQGRIIDILPQETAKQQYQAKEVISLPEHVVLPGFINAHTHSPMTLLRGLADDLAFMDWLQNNIWPVEKKYMGPEFVEDGAKLALVEMIRCGTIGFNEHYFCHETLAKVAVESGMRARIGVMLLELADLVGQSNLEYISKEGIGFIEKYKHHPLVQPSFAPHSPYAVSEKSLLAVHELAETHQIPIHIHLQETVVEVEQYQREHGKRLLQRLSDVGFLSPWVQAVHMTQQVNDEDIELLRKSGASVVHCPESNLKLVSGSCPVQKLLQAGVVVALGTDGPASNNDLDMLGEMRTAALIGKLVAHNETAVSAADVLRMATLNGAKAMRWDKEVGSLEVGKSADIIAIDLSDANTQPVYNPISHIVYAAHSHQVTDVWVQGRALMKNRELTTLDEKAIMEKTKVWRERIKS
jgi:5-methylthioadenosine/S-adenosylhomocysteine deaminase